MNWGADSGRVGLAAGTGIETAPFKVEILSGERARARGPRWSVTLGDAVTCRSNCRVWSAVRRKDSSPPHPAQTTRATMSETFPAIGHRYLVDFQKFRVELYFESETSLTYAGIHPDGSRGSPETVVITVEPIRDQLFLVTWQEAG